MQAPAHRPHFLLLWIGILLLSMMTALKVLTSAEEPPAAQQPARAVPPLRPTMTPFAEELPMLLDENGQPIAPLDQDAKLAEGAAERPRLQQDSSETDAVPAALASRTAEVETSTAQAVPDLRPVRQSPPHEPRDLPSYVGRSVSSAQDDDRLDPDAIHQAPPPMLISLGALAENFEESAEEAGLEAQPPAPAVQVWVVPITPVDLWTVVVETSDEDEDPRVEGDAEDAAESEDDQAQDRPRSDDQILRDVAEAARQHALATGKFSAEDFQRIWAAAQKRAGQRTPQSFLRRMSPDEFRAFLAEVLRAAA